VRIVHLTAGAGKRYCGACLRDTSLVEALSDLGHEVTLQSLYLPIHDEEGVEAEGRIGMGGIATWLAASGAALSLLARPMESALGARPLLRMVARLGEMTEPSTLGPMTEATLRVDGPAMTALCERVAQEAAALEPDVILLSNALLLGFSPLLKRHTSALVVCTLQSESDFIEDLADPWPGRVWSTLRDLSTEADAFIAVSAAHRDEMAERIGLDAALISVVPHGIHASSYGPDPCDAPHRRIAFLARLDERHGAHRLLEAVATLPLGETPITLTLAGSMTSIDRPYVKRLRARVRELNLEDRVSVRPNISPSDKRAMLGHSGVFCVPTSREAAGRYLLEAWASGCAVVAPRVGSLLEFVEDTQGGLLYDPAEEAALGRALRDVCENESLAMGLAQAGQAAVKDRYQSEHMATGLLSVLEGLTPLSPANIDTPRQHQEAR
jgi:glycosyltransferase involved in cell wall biosynthesis